MAATGRPFLAEGHAAVTPSLPYSSTLSPAPVLPSPADCICAAALKALYAKHDKLPGLISNYKQPITSINLSITEYQIKASRLKERGDEKGELKASLAHFDALHQIKHPIAPADMFNKLLDASGQLETKAAKHILIVGEPGVGKTTMSQWFAHQWATRAFLADKFDYVFWIPLRNLPTLVREAKSELDLVQIIHRECFKANKAISISQISAILTKQRDRVLIIADGYDEIASLFSTRIDSDPSRIAGILREILQSEYVIFTSRPYQLHHLPQADFRRLENVGFTDENIKEYVPRYFRQLTPPQPTWGESLLTFLKSNPSIWGTARIPLNLELICEAFYANEVKKIQITLSSEEKGELPILASPIQNMTMLYEQLSISLLKRYIEYHKKMGHQQKVDCQEWESPAIIQACKVEFDFLSRLAFEGLEANEIIISATLQRKVLKKIEQHYPRKEQAEAHFVAILKSGFLRCSDAESGSLEINKPHYFIHLTFQEFLAAYYLVECLKNSAETAEHQLTKQFIKNKKYRSRYQRMFGFMAGLLSLDKNSAEALAIFWELLWNEPRDLTNVMHTRLMLRCLEESGCDPRIPHSAQIFDELKEWAVYFLDPSWFADKSHEVLDEIFPFFQQAPLVLKQTGFINRIAQELEKNANRDKEAIILLGKFKAITPTILPALIRSLLSTNEIIQLAAAEALIESPIATPLLTPVFYEALEIAVEPMVKETIAIAFINNDVVSLEMISAFYLGMKDKVLIFDQEIEQILLKKLNVSSSKDIPTLVRMLADKNDWIRRYAAVTLGNVTISSFEIIEALICALNDKHVQVRLNVISALEKLMQQTNFSITLYVQHIPTLIPALISILKDNQEFSWLQAQSVGKIAEKILDKFLVKIPEEVISALILEYKTNSDTRNSVMRLLNHVAILPLEMTQIMRELFSSAAWTHCNLYELSKMIMRVAPDLVKEIISLSTVGKSRRIRAQAVSLLGELALQSAPVIDNIIHSLDTGEHKQAIQALNQIAWMAPAVLLDKAHILIKIRKNTPDFSTKRFAISCLTTLSIEQPKLIVELVTLLKEEKDKINVRLTTRAFHQVDMTNSLGALDVSQLHLAIAPWACFRATPLRALMQMYIATPTAEWASIVARSAFFRAIPLTLTAEGVYIDEGQRDDKPLPLSKEQATGLIQALAKYAAQEQRPCSFYESLLEWDSAPVDQDVYVIRKKLVGQIIKITLNHDHAEMKDPYHAFNQALEHCNSTVKTLDLSHNQLDDLSMICLAEFLQKTPYQWKTLNLSHNKITAEGLEIILKVLSKNPFIESILLAHNYIAFDSYFYQKVVEPGVTQARLKKLDLSMNFIYPADMLEAKGVRGDYLKLVRDKNHPNDKLTEEKELYRRSLFEKSAVVISTPSPLTVSSLINPENKLDKDFAVISLCAFKTTLPPLGEHAFLVIESIGHLGQRSIIIGELFVVGKNVSIQVAYSSPTDFLRRVQGERIHHQSATKGKIETEKLLREMLKSRNHQSFHRYSLFPSARQGIYNCYQWAAEMLRVIDIKIDPDDIPSVAVGKKSRCRPTPRCTIS